MEIDSYYVTFGVQYGRREDAPKHSLGMFGDGYAVIDAPSYEIARAMASAIFGQEWAFIYDYEFILDPRRAELYPAGELLHIGWVQRPIEEAA